MGGPTGGVPIPALKAVAFVPPHAPTGGGLLHPKGSVRLVDSGSIVGQGQAMEASKEAPQVAVFASEDGQATPQAAGTIYKAAIWTYVDNILARDVMQVSP